MRKKCSTDREKVEAEGQYFANTRSICSNSERSEQFLVTELFFNYSWRFLRYNKSEQLELEFFGGISKHAGKIRKRLFSSHFGIFEALPIWFI